MSDSIAPHDSHSSHAHPTASSGCKPPHGNLPQLDGLDACIHCGMCLPACPTYLATGSEAESPRGRLYLMKKWIQDELEESEIKPHLDQCLACHSCETACPSGVQYGRLLMETRASMAPHRKGLARNLKRFIFNHILPNDALLRLSGFLLWFYQRSKIQAMVHRLGLLKIIPALATQEALLPKIPHNKALKAGMTFGPADGSPVTLLIGCVMDVFYNPIHWDTITVLAANGYRVSIPERTCCGALAHHAGEIDITEHLGWQTVAALLAPKPDWVVINSAGCGSSIKDYSHLLKPQSEEQTCQLQKLAAKVVDVTELLAQKPLAPFHHSVPMKVAYHAACHLYHVQKVQKQPIELLSQIPGIELVPLESADMCCGSAGIYNLEHPDLSEEILAEKMQHVRQACTVGQANVLTTGNPGCLLQLTHGVESAKLDMQVLHPISIMAKGYKQT